MVGFNCPDVGLIGLNGAAFAVEHTPLVVEMGHALNFADTPIENLHPNTYDAVSNLVDHYKLDCGRPNYRDLTGSSSRNAHIEYLYSFKPTIARVFGERLDNILQAKDPVSEYDHEQLASLNFADMVRGGILTYRDAEDFNIGMAKIALDSMKSRSVELVVSGGVFSKLSTGLRIFVYIAVGALNMVDPHAMYPALLGCFVAAELANFLIEKRMDRKNTTIHDGLVRARSVHEACDRSLLGLRGLLINELARQNGTGKLPFGA